MTAFELDARLAQDTHLLADGPSCLLLMMNDCRYPWLILVPKRPDVREWHDLDSTEQQTLHRLSIRIGQALQRRFTVDKINTATLGNVVNQFHIHIVGRRVGDPAWPGPVWGHSQAVPYSPAELQQTLSTLRAESIPDWIT